VDKEDAPDYYDIIKTPMDLSTMYDKVNKEEYSCAAEFIADIDLICSNCLEYNPDRQLRSTAFQFRDVVHAVIKAEMDTDFEEECQKISKSRKQRSFDNKKYLMDFINVAPVDNSKKNETENVAADEAPADPVQNGLDETLNGEGKFCC
jgi:ATPase family AAA domain-containing protein 2